MRKKPHDRILREEHKKQYLNIVPKPYFIYIIYYCSKYETCFFFFFKGSMKPVQFSKSRQYILA